MHTRILHDGPRLPWRVWPNSHEDAIYRAKQAKLISNWGITRSFLSGRHRVDTRAHCLWLG